MLLFTCPFARTNFCCPRSEQGENPCPFQYPPVVHDSILPPVAPDGKIPAAGKLPSLYFVQPAPLFAPDPDWPAPTAPPPSPPDPPYQPEAPPPPQATNNLPFS